MAWQILYNFKIILPVYLMINQEFRKSRNMFQSSVLEFLLMVQIHYIGLVEIVGDHIGVNKAFSK